MGNIWADECNGKKIYVDGYHLWKNSETPPILTASYYIDWGDGSSPQNLGTTTKASANHTYSTTGTKHITITAFHGIDTYTWEDDIAVTSGCSDHQKSKATWFYHGGGWAVRGYVETVNFLIWHRVNVTSESYLWNGSTHVQTKCEHLVAKVYGNILDSGCGLDFAGSKENGSKICSSISTAMHVGHYYKWNSLESCHAIKGGETWYPRYQTIEPCE